MGLNELILFSVVLTFLSLVFGGGLLYAGYGFGYFLFAVGIVACCFTAFIVSSAMAITSIRK